MSEDGHAQDSNTRLNRIEGILETFIVAHQDFIREHKQLLTAQIVLTDRVDTLTKAVGELREAQQHTDELVNALIGAIEGWYRKGGGE